jgi:hypothetical protein
MCVGCSLMQKTADQTELQKWEKEVLCRLFILIWEFHLRTLHCHSITLWAALKARREWHATCGVWIINYNFFFCSLYTTLLDSLPHRLHPERCWNKNSQLIQVVCHDTTFFSVVFVFFYSFFSSNQSNGKYKRVQASAEAARKKRVTESSFSML